MYYNGCSFQIKHLNAELSEKSNGTRYNYKDTSNLLVLLTSVLTCNNENDNNNHLNKKHLVASNKMIQMIRS